jgi:hypothetical protein
MKSKLSSEEKAPDMLILIPSYVTALSRSLNFELERRMELKGLLLKHVAVTK